MLDSDSALAAAKAQSRRKVPVMVAAQAVAAASNQLPLLLSIKTVFGSTRSSPALRRFWKKLLRQSVRLLPQKADSAPIDSLSA